MVKPPPPVEPPPRLVYNVAPPPMRTVPSKDQLADIIARATEAAEAARATEAKAAAEVEEAAEKKRLAKIRRKERAERKEKEKAKRKAKGEKPSSSVDKAVEKDKRLVKLVGEVVVKYMSQYRDQMDHDVFKKHAKEVKPSHHPHLHRMLTICHSSLISLLRKRRGRLATRRENSPPYPTRSVRR